MRLRRAAVSAVTAVLALVCAVALVGALQRPDTTLPAGLRGRHVLVDGVRLRVAQAGQGPDVLLIHGSPGSVEDWDPVFDTLAARFRVTAFDRPGHGYSEGHRLPHTPTENARVVLALLRALDLHDTVLVGHSYGGGTALRVAVSNPPGVRALVVLGSRAYPPVGAPLLFRALAAPYLGPGLATLLTPLLRRARLESASR